VSRQLNHVELVYRPGERRLARELLEALGCRVIDPQVDPVPPDLGPAAGPYLIVFVEPSSRDLIDNVIYASEVRPEQWRLEQRLCARLGGSPELQELQRTFRSLPQAMTHIGMAFPSTSELEAALARLEASAALRGRVHLSPVYRPGEPGSVDDRVVQAFVFTDVLSTGLLAVGQSIELQARVSATGGG
jgi:hypothetical protein